MDIGSAVLLAALGFEALATTSGGFAASKGRLDGSMGREQVLAHTEELVAATALPLSVDLENCFADEPEGVAETARAAIDAGVAGFSVEDFTGDANDPIYGLELAADRVRAACEAAHEGEQHIVVTAVGRELPSRTSGPGGHHRTAAGLPGGRRRRRVRTQGRGSERAAQADRRGRTSRSASWPGPTPPTWRSCRRSE